MKADIDLIERALGHELSKAARQNAKQILVALDGYGEQFGLDKPHRLAQYLAQITHESGEFKYDKEVWGPTPAQKRYDTRTNLGNSPEQDGDGFLFRGRSGIQITGKANYTQFRDWCRTNIRADTTDFAVEPDKVLTDPWEGLAPIWYWSTRKLNKYADEGNTEMITRRINGGTNGLSERLNLFTRFALVMLGFGSTAVSDFQEGAKLEGLYKGDVDGLSGPQTRSALHVALAKLTDSKVTAAPVTEKVTEVVTATPPALDKPLTQTFGFWERIGQIGGALGAAGLGALFEDWKVVMAFCGGLILLSIVGLLLHNQIINAVKDLKKALAS